MDILYSKYLQQLCQVRAEFQQRYFTFDRNDNCLHNWFISWNSSRNQYLKFAELFTAASPPSSWGCCAYIFLSFPNYFSTTGKYNTNMRLRNVELDIKYWLIGSIILLIRLTAFCKVSDLTNGLDTHVTYIRIILCVVC